MQIPIKTGKAMFFFFFWKGYVNIRKVMLISDKIYLQPRKLPEINYTLKIH